MVTLKVKTLYEGAILPAYAYPGDAGMDLFSVDDKIIQPNDIALINTGIVIELPPMTEAQIRPRSGLALKHGVTVLNTPGTIDEGYHGEIGIILINHGKEPFHVTKEMRIAQLVVKPTLIVSIVKVSEIQSSKRGSDGFGSSGV